MYKRVVLAYDGSVEGRIALREAALAARGWNAQVFLLSIIAETQGMRLAESAHAGAIAQEHDVCQSILDEGVDRLRRLGMSPQSALEMGEPAQVIVNYARKVKADLVVVGHRRRGVISRWWAGSTGAYLLDHIDCSLLIARNIISDEAIRAELNRGMDH